MNFDKEVGASGLSCPLPVVQTKKAPSNMASGQAPCAVATDPGLAADMEAFAEPTGNRSLEQSAKDKKYVVFLRKT